MTFIAYFPALISVISVLFPGPGPSYSFLVPSSMFAILLFVALVSPELLCPDRRSGALVMYMTSCLRPVSYLAAKVLAMLALLSFLTVGPGLLLLLATVFLGKGPSGLGAGLTLFGQIAGAGLMFAAFYGVLALAVSSFTDRRAFAAAAIVLGMVLVSAALGIAEGPLKAPHWVSAFNLTELPADAAYRILNLFPPRYNADAHSFTNLEAAGAVSAWVAAGLAVLYWRYRGEGTR